MHYPDSFKTRCREVYPDWDDLHRLVESGSSMVGRHLSDSSGGGISVEEILACTDLALLTEKALKLKTQTDLYVEWSNLYDAQFKSR